jgi:DNA-binding PadR family transcriptional regulator
MEREGPSRLERSLLLHLLEHRGQQVRFEADQWTTEFGIFRAFAHEDLASLKNTLRSLEMTRYIYRRVQYVIGYSEPKLVYSLTPSGHRKALDLRREDGGDEAAPVEIEAAPLGPVAPREFGA